MPASLLLLLQQSLTQAQAAAQYHGTGREWMVTLSIVVPLLLLLILIYLGSKRTVS